MVKVERPEGGDPARRWGPPFVSGAGSIFAFTNRGKRSIALDLRSDEGRDTLRTLIGQSDVLIEALRPGALERLGFGPDAVRELNPRLVYCSVGAYGEKGPLRALPGYDPLMQAHAGLMSVTGAVGGGPARVGTSLVDMGTGMWLAVGVLAALRERETTGGPPPRISTSLYDTALAWNGYHLLGVLAEGTVPRAMGSELPMIAPYGAFPTADGQLMIAAANDGLFRRLCACLGLEDAAADGRFATNPDRVANRAAVNAAVSAGTSSHSTEGLLQLLRDAGVPCAPIQDLFAVAEDPQTEASGMLVRTEAGPAVALPLRRDGERFPVRGGVPAAGQDSVSER